MINNDIQSNLKLTDEHTKEIEAYQLKLSNLLSNIVIATKTLKVNKSDNDTLVKDKQFSEEKLEKVNVELAPKLKQLEVLDAELNDKNLILRELESKIISQTEAYRIKANEMNERETAVIEKEKELAEQQEIFKNTTEIYLKNAEIYDAKVAKLKEVIKDF